MHRLHSKIKSLLPNRTFATYSTVESTKIKQDILIVDQIGLLADIYRCSEFAFIGGSFKSKIHSVMEALCADNIVFFGPKHSNNSEAIEFSDLKLAFSFETADQCLQQIQSLSQTHKAELKQKIHQLCINKKGASKKIAEYLLT